MIQSLICFNYREFYIQKSCTHQSCTRFDLYYNVSHIASKDNKNISYLVPNILTKYFEVIHLSTITIPLKNFIISIIENIFHFFFIALMITAIIFLTMTSDGYKDPYGNISFTNPQLWITFIVISFILLILNTILSTFILATEWENEYSRKNNKLWGLLSLFLLGSISLLIFTKKSIKYCRKVENKNEAR